MTPIISRICSSLSELECLLLRPPHCAMAWCKRMMPRLKCELCRRATVEPVIGHAEYHMGRYYI